MLKVLTRETDAEFTLAVDADGKPRPIGENPQFAEAQRLAGKIEAEIKAIDRRIQAIQGAAFLESERAADGRNKTTGDAALAAARRMIEGGDVVPDAGDLAEVPKLERRRATLGAARCRQNEILEKLRSDLSHAACLTKTEAHKKALRDLLSAARLLARCAAVEQAVRREVMDAGFLVSEDVLPTPHLGAGLILGNESSPASPLAMFRRQLEQLGIIAK